MMIKARHGRKYENSCKNQIAKTRYILMVLVVFKRTSDVDGLMHMLTYK